MSSRNASITITVLLIATLALMGGAEAMQAKKTFDNRISKINNPFTMNLPAE